MKTVFEILEQVAAATGKQKEVVLKGHIENQLLMKTLKYALDPMLTFGVGKKTIQKIEKKVTISGSSDWSDTTWLTLDKFAAREITGGQAESTLGIARTMLSDDMWSLFTRILLKDLRGGFTADTVNRAKPKTINVFKVMLAHKYEANRVKNFPVNVETKLDGVRVTTIVDLTQNEVTTFSRTGKEFTTFDTVKEQLLRASKAALPNGVGTLMFDGEIMSGEFNKTVGDVHRKNHQADDATYYMFDFMTGFDFFEGSDTPQHKRRSRLLSLMKKANAVCDTPNIRVMKSVECHSHEEIDNLFNDYFEKGIEGIIVKDPQAPYVNKRSYGFMKVKGEESEDLTVIDVEEGEAGKKYEGMTGALVVDFNGNRVNVGSGLSDDQRREFWANKDEVIGRIIEVEYHEVTPDGSLRHPRFKRFRDTLVKGVKE